MKGFINTTTTTTVGPKPIIFGIHSTDNRIFYGCSKKASRLILLARPDKCDGLDLMGEFNTDRERKGVVFFSKIIKTFK